MGCAPMRGIRVTSKAEMTAIEEFHPPKALEYKIGTAIPTRSNTPKLVVFVFGGPGSQKGLATHEMITQFEFQSINVEEIVLGYLPSKFNNQSTDDVLRTANDVQDLLKKDTGALSLDWIFSVIMGKISGSMNQRFVIDIIPALSSMLRADSFSSEDDCKRALEEFERSYPIFFAIDLDVDLRPSSMTTEKKENEKPQEKQNLSSEMKTFLKGIDEADKGRLEKRLDAYNKVAAPFLSYFRKSERLVTVNVSSMPTHDILSVTVVEMLQKLRFTRSYPYTRVILFVTDHQVFERIDTNYYNMRKIRMSDVLQGRGDNDSLASQVRGIRAHIEATGHNRKESFAVVADVLHQEAVAGSKRTSFVEKKQGFIDEFLRGPRLGKPIVRQRLKMVAIPASPDETLLFVDPFPGALATKVGLLWTERPTSRSTITPSPTDPPANGGAAL